MTERTPTPVLLLGAIDTTATPNQPESISSQFPELTTVKYTDVPISDLTDPQGMIMHAPMDQLSRFAFVELADYEKLSIIGVERKEQENGPDKWFAVLDNGEISSEKRIRRAGGTVLEAFFSGAKGSDITEFLGLESIQSHINPNSERIILENDTGLDTVDWAITENEAGARRRIFKTDVIESGEHSEINVPSIKLNVQLGVLATAHALGVEMAEVEEDRISFRAAITKAIEIESTKQETTRKETSAGARIPSHSDATPITNKTASHPEEETSSPDNINHTQLNVPEPLRSKLFTGVRMLPVQPGVSTEHYWIKPSKARKISNIWRDIKTLFKSGSPDNNYPDCRPLIATVSTRLGIPLDGDTARNGDYITNTVNNDKETMIPGSSLADPVTDVASPGRLFPERTGHGQPYTVGPSSTNEGIRKNAYDTIIMSIQNGQTYPVDTSLIYKTPIQAFLSWRADAPMRRRARLTNRHQPVIPNKSQTLHLNRSLISQKTSFRGNQKPKY